MVATRARLSTRIESIARCASAKLPRPRKSQAAADRRVVIETVLQVVTRFVRFSRSERGCARFRARFSRAETTSTAPRSARTDPEGARASRGRSGRMQRCTDFVGCSLVSVNACVYFAIRRRCTVITFSGSPGRVHGLIMQRARACARGGDASHGSRTRAEPPRQSSDRAQRAAGRSVKVAVSGRWSLPASGAISQESVVKSWVCQTWSMRTQRGHGTPR